MVISDSSLGCGIMRSLGGVRPAEARRIAGEKVDVLRHALEGVAVSSHNDKGRQRKALFAVGPEGTVIASLDDQPISSWLERPKK
jgi:hypothetical protein